MSRKEAKTVDENDPAALEKALEADISGKSFLTREEENRLAEAYKNNSDSRAFEKLWDNHQGIINKIVIKEHKRAAHVDYDDLMQEAARGFMKGLRKFDPERGFRLMSYAYWWVNERVQRYVNKNQTIQKTPNVFPTKYKDARAHYFALQREFEEAGQEWPPKDGNVKREFKEKTGIDFHEIVNVLSDYYNQAVSLDASVDRDRENGDSLLDGLADTAPTVFDRIAQISERNALDRAMAGLKEGERDVLRRRYGIDTGVEETLKQISQDHGVSCERIRQIQVKAEEKLKSALVSRLHDIADDDTQGSTVETPTLKGKEVRPS